MVRETLINSPECEENQKEDDAFVELAPEKIKDESQSGEDTINFVIAV